MSPPSCGAGEKHQMDIIATKKFIFMSKTSSSGVWQGTLLIIKRGRYPTKIAQNQTNKEWNLSRLLSY
jgi:hypothetical protein